MPAHPDETHSDGEPIARAAAEWFYRRQPGLTAAQEAEFLSWLKADPRHAEVLSEMEETSRLLDRLQEPALARGKPSAFPSILRRPVVFRRRARLWAASGLAAAAAVAGLLWWHPVALAGRTFPSFATEVGGLRRIELSDGSAVQLNTDSAIEVRYTAAERRVRLVRGEGFFTVAKNPARPFWAEAGAISVRAVGTAFNIRYQPDSVQVLVTEGKVRVNDRAGRSVLPDTPSRAGPEPGSPLETTAPPHGERLLIAGQRADISIPSDAIRPERPATVVAVEPRGIESALGWRQQRLEFSSAPLSEMVAEFNRYNSHKLRIADPALGRQRFGGAFATHDFDAFVGLLEQGFGVTAEQHGDETILRQTR